MPLLSSLLHVTLGSAWIIPIVFLGLLDTVFTENGFEHYAEFPKFVPPFEHPIMVGNAVVNFGYVVVGLMWLWTIRSLRASGAIVKDDDAYMLCVFNWMATLYGFVQLFRIVTQWHEMAVLDQWVTLPIFMWAYVFCEYIRNDWTWSRHGAIFWMSASFASYGLTLVSDIGFEIALGLHILLVLRATTNLTRARGNRDVTLNFVYVVLSCVGFVGLKLLDLQLAEVHPFFTVVSGHFLSKIADIAQFHFGSKFFIQFLINLRSKEE